jgi:CelD/BcsL family acetyltransferase involved in cellulose biosynthesis
VNLDPTNSPTTLRVVRFPTLDQLSPLAADWDRLARGVPFRGWAWASSWWRHYGHDGCQPRPRTALFILGVLDQAGAPLGFAPWYLDQSASQGRVLRFLGSGEVCTDYLTVLSAPEDEHRVAAALAEWLTKADAQSPTHGDPNGWDLLELTGVDASDTAVGQLACQLEARGHTLHRRHGMNCWRIELPGCWDDYLATLSKDHRKKIRRSVRDLLDSERVTAHRVERLDDLPHAQQVLIDLHQRRRLSLGEPGNFASRRFTDFHCEVMSRLLALGQLRLNWLLLDGQPLAAEYLMFGDGVLYAYQSGMNPDAVRHSPGRLSLASVLRQAIDDGYRAVDLLRGDVPYKAHWRARPRKTAEIRVIPARPLAQFRHGIWRTGAGLKQWIRTTLNPVIPQ